MMSPPMRQASACSRLKQVLVVSSTLQMISTLPMSSQSCTCGRSVSFTRHRFALPLVLALLGACRAAPPPLPPGGVIGTAPEKAPPPLVGHNLIYNDDFSEGTRSLPWTSSFSGTGAGRSFVEKGELCLEVTNKGSNRWDAHLR